jgi:hypothetical protein
MKIYPTLFNCHFARALSMVLLISAVLLNLACEQQVVFSAKDFGVFASPGPSSGDNSLSLAIQTQNNIKSGNSFATDVRPGAPLDKCPYGGLTIVRAKDANGNGLIDLDEPVLEAGTNHVCNSDPYQYDVTDGAPSDKCPFGGFTQTKWRDINRDTKVDQSEIIGVSYLCQKDTGTQTAISIITGVPAGKCSGDIGGFTVKKGIDLNRNGELDNNENIVTTQYFCQVKQPTYVTEITKLNATDGCLLGGIIVNKGLDADGDGKIDSIATAESQTFCDQMPIYAEISVSLQAGAPVDQCAADVGGFTVTKFVDSNHNSALDSGEEIKSKNYICQSQQPAIATEVVPLTEGAECAGGGVQVAKGIDANVDGKIDVGAEKTIQNICNKAVNPMAITVTTPPPTPFEPNNDYIIDTPRTVNFDATLSDKFLPGQSISFFGKGTGAWKIRLPKDWVIMAKYTSTNTYPVEIDPQNLYDFTRIHRPIKNRTVYGVHKASGRIYSTSDSGNSWQADSTGPVSLESDYILLGENEGNGIAQVNLTTGSIKLSNDKGQTFNSGFALAPFSTNPPSPPKIFKLRISPDGTTATVLGAVKKQDFTASLKFFRTTDAGKTWSEVPELESTQGIKYLKEGMLIDGASVNILGHSADGKVIYSRGGGSQIFCSVNSGVSWSLIPTEVTHQSQYTSMQDKKSDNPILNYYSDSDDYLYVNSTGSHTLISDSQGTVFEIKEPCGQAVAISKTANWHPFFIEHGPSLFSWSDPQGGVTIYDSSKSTTRNINANIDYTNFFFINDTVPGIMFLHYPWFEGSMSLNFNSGDITKPSTGFSSLGPYGGFVGTSGFAVKLKYQGSGVFTVESLTAQVPLM